MRVAPFKEYHPRMVKYWDKVSQSHKEHFVDAVNHADAVQKTINDVSNSIQVLSSQEVK